MLVDGLAAEREQGITIDVAYRFFATGKRQLIVADCQCSEGKQNQCHIAEDVHDSETSYDHALIDSCIELLMNISLNVYDRGVLAVRHDVFLVEGAAGLREFGRLGTHVLYNLKGALKSTESDTRL